MHILLLFSLLFWLPGATPFYQAPDDILGKWTDERKLSHIEIRKSGETYTGKIVWLSSPNKPDATPRLDARNPDVSKNKNPVLGTTILWGLRHNQGKWTGGSIYSPEKGQVADCVVEIQPDGKLKLNVSKYTFSTTRLWTRVK